jgi:hypothetical protein
MFQFSLRNLLVAVAVVAVGTAALLNANEWWASLLWGAALSILVFAGLVALFRREAQRAFWSGYVVAGSFYLLLLMFGNGTFLPLITTKVIAWGYSFLPDAKKSQYMLAPAPPAGGNGGVGMGGIGGGGPGMPSMMSGMGGGGMSPPVGGKGGMPGGGMGMVATLNSSYVDQNEFMKVGNALWMLILSWLSGIVALGLYRTRGTSVTAT